MAFKHRTSTVASAARTTTASSPAIQVVDLGDTLTVFVDVTAQSGTTPTLNISVEWSHDGATFFTSDPPDAFTQIAAATPKVCKNFTIKAIWYRITWTLAGTSPNYTFQTHEYIS